MLALAGLFVFGVLLLLGIVSWALGGDGGVAGIDRSCQENSVGCNAAIEALGTLAAVCGAIVWFSFFRINRVLRPHLDKAASDPASLVPTASPIDEVVGRDGLCEIIEKDLIPPDARPQVIVAGVGDGKTAVLVALVEHLYRRGAVPVAVALRNAPEHLDFQDLAKDQFIDRIGPSILSEDEGDKIWRELCASRDVVVLADGLEEAIPKIQGAERASQIRTALQRAAQSRLPLVITSRPQPELEKIDAALIRLEPLPARRVVSYIEQARDGNTDLIETVARAAEIMERPLYLRLARSLHRSDRLGEVPSESRIAARLGLLREWRKEIRDHGVEHAETRRQDRVDALDLAEKAACAALAENELEITLDQVYASPFTKMDKSRREADLLIEQASWLDVVEPIPDGVRFRHSILQAYLGACGLDTMVKEDPPGFRAYLDKALENPGRELTMALVMLCVLDGNTERAVALRNRLLAAARTPGRPRHTKFELLAAAYEIQSLTGSSGGDTLAKMATELWMDERKEPLDVETTEAKLRAILPIAEAGARPDPTADATLWSIATLENEYAVRFQAAQELAGRGDAALAVIDDEVTAAAIAGSRALAYEKGAAPTIRWDEVRRYTVLGWTMPLLAASCSEPGAETLRSAITNWVDVAAERRGPAGPRLHLGVEAALAQGFKWEANRLPAEDNREARDFLIHQALRLLDSSAWWQTEMALVQALTLWALDRGEPRRREIMGRLYRYRSRPGHPLVREASRLCIHALAIDRLRPGESPGPSRHLWIDEAGVAAKVGASEVPRDDVKRLWIPPAAGWSALTARAQQLVGEALVYLNLIEKVDDAEAGAINDDDRTRCTDEREQRRALTYAQAGRLPECLRRASQRERLRVDKGDPPGKHEERCADGCRFGLCPYPQKHDAPFRGELTETFCRGQVRLLREDHRLPRWEAGPNRPARVRGRAFRQIDDFWDAMERRDRH